MPGYPAVDVADHALAAAVAPVANHASISSLVSIVFQAIGAQEEEIAGADLDLFHLDGEISFTAKRARHHAPERMRFRFFLGEEARDHLLIDPGMVVGQ